MKKKIFLPILFIILAITLIFMVNQKKVAAIAAGQISKIAFKKGIAIQFVEPSFGLTSLQAAQTIITAKVKFFLINLPIVKPQLLASPLNLVFAKEKELKLLGNLFAGDFFIHLQKINLAKRSFKAEATWNKINIAEFSLLPLLGINSGIFFGNLNSFEFSPESLDLDAKFNLHDVNKPKKTRLPAMLTGLPMDLEIPAIKNLSCQGQVKISGSTLNLDISQLSSSLLSISNLSGETLYFDKQFRRPRKINYQGELTLTSAGHSELASYLRLLGAQPLADQKMRFSIYDDFADNKAISIVFN